jgi:soluble lytic murein transglycosylase-like protein
MQQESSFNHLAVGPAGEHGLMLLSPNTARSLEVPWDQAFDIETNVCGGTRYLAGLVARYRDPEKTAHHYNGGGDPLYAMRVSRHLLRIAREFPRREFDPGRAAILAGLARKEAVRHELGTERF